MVKAGEDSLKKRYAAKLGGRFVNYALGMATLGIVPKVLGPAQYGAFGFLTHFFANVFKFLGMGTPAAFYMMLSNRQDERKLIGFYAWFVGLMGLAVSLGIGGALLLGMGETVWPGQRGGFVWAAALFSLLTVMASFVHQISDAYALTVKVEIFFVLQSVLSTACILALYFSDRLNLTTYFIANCILSVLVVQSARKVLNANGIRLLEHIRFDKSEIKSYLSRFYAYSHPLFAHALIVFVVAIGDRWLLQRFSGSVNQGFYNLAFKLGSFLFMFTSSMSGLFSRELSVSHGKGDQAAMRNLFGRYIPMFFFISAFFAVFIGVNAALVCDIVGGEAYRGAAPVVAILAFYPIYQTYGQLSGSLFLATGQTRRFRNIGAGFEILGLCATFLLIAPRGSHGLEMGAAGLALKVVSVQFVIVNIQLIYNTRYLSLPMRTFALHQAATLGLLAALAWGAGLTLSHGAPAALPALARFAIAGLLYSAAVALIVLLYPRIASVDKAQLARYAEFIRGFIMTRVLKKGIIQ